MPVAEREERSEPLKAASDTAEERERVAKAIEHAKFKNMRLRLMKARNENYLAEQRLEAETDEEQTHEL